MKLVGVGLCLIGIGLIGYGILVAARATDIPRRLPKGKPAGTYESDMDWDFSEDRCKEPLRGT